MLVDEVTRMVDRYWARHEGWSLRHFYSWHRRDGGKRSYSWVKNKLPGIRVYMARHVLYVARCPIAPNRMGRCPSRFQKRSMRLLSVPWLDCRMADRSATLARRLGKLCRGAPCSADLLHWWRKGAWFGRVAEVERLVRAPIQQRPPVGYNRAFLEDYVPGLTWYLPEEVRSHLLELGNLPDHEGVAGTYVRKIHERLLIDLSWNSSRLEGNTYSLLETARLLESGESAVGRDALETQMILNHKAAIKLLVDEAEHVGFNRYTILNLHALLAENLLPDPSAGGRLRSTGVHIGSSTYHPLEIPQLIDECFGQVLDKAAAIPDSFEQVFFALVHLPYLQPFLDVNKRVSRLAANLPLIHSSLCPLSFVDVPTQDYVNGLLGIYERNQVELLRDVFCWAYERSCARYSAVRQSLGKPDPFRLQHRALIAQTIRQVVQARMNKPAAAAHILQQAAENLPEAERNKFIEIVETDLLNLHGGNIAKAQLSPREFETWQTEWR